VIHRVLAIGLIAGFAAGLAIAALQHVSTTPLILAAEVYEAAQHAHDAADAAEGWSPAPGVQRLVATSLATVGLAVGYALMLLAAMLIAAEEIAPSRALVWACGGFAATGLATSFGLAPQLPGAAEADLAARQLWWVGTALATAGGLYALLRREEVTAKAIGIVLLLAPHLYGAPQAARPESTVPAELAARFAAASIGVQAVLWCLVGALVGVLWRRLAPPATEAR
jgi:cobalt transporter subunit CbtA